MTEHNIGPEKPRVLLFGGSGAIGRSLLERLSGARIDAWTRSNLEQLQSQAAHVRWHQGALPDAPALTPETTHILSLGPGDVFVEWLARQSPQPALRQVIVLGSTSADSKIDSSSALERDLAARLRRAQSRLIEHSARLEVPWTLLRPTLIYGGSDDSVARIGRWIRRRHVYPLLLGRGAFASRQPVHASDLAQAVFACIDLHDAFDRVFDLPGAETLSLRAFIERIARACGRLALPLPIPLITALRVLSKLDLIPAHAALQTVGLKRLERDQTYDGTPAVATLGYSPRPFTPDPREWQA